MDDAPLFALARRNHGVFSRAQARELDIGPGALRHRVDKHRIEQLSHHVFRVSGSPITSHAQVMALVLSGGPEAIASGATALALNGIRDFALLPAVAVVGRRPPRGAMPGVRESFRVLEAHRTVVDGIPCATVARALFDDARGQPRRRIERRVDAALSARRGLYGELITMLDDLAASGRSGITNLREVLADRNDAYCAPTTWLEERFLELTRAYGIPDPDRQVEIHGRAGRIGTVDFTWGPERVIVETDGATFHDSATDRQNDERRDKALEREGLTVLRFNRNDILHRPTSVVRLIRNALRTAA